jgi:hypothetical protein
MNNKITIAALLLALLVFTLFVSRENAREVINLIIR